MAVEIGLTGPAGEGVMNEKLAEEGMSEKGIDEGFNC